MVNSRLKEQLRLENHKVRGLERLAGSRALGREGYANNLKNRLERKDLKVLKTLSLTLGKISESQLREIRETLTMQMR